MEKIESFVISRDLRPRCPRDNHVMRYEPAAIRTGEAGRVESLPSYHCPYLGCCVRYEPMNGYFTVINEPDEPFFVDEPGTNLARCPLHGTWLYRAAEEGANRFGLRCGIEGCDYQQADVEGIWLRE